MKFSEGDHIIVVDGDFKGQHGSVIKYEEIFENYHVHLPDVSLTGFVCCKEDELAFLDQRDEPVDPNAVAQNPDEEVYDEIRVPSFGMTEAEFLHHMEYVLIRALERVPTVGPEDVFFGFQEFESGTASDKLSLVLEKIEKAMALFVQAHVLVGRSIIALETVYGQAD